MEMNRKKKSYDAFFPLSGVQDGIIISKRGDFTFGWELELPSAYSLLESEYDVFAQAWSSAIKVLPPWCVVHRQDIFIYEKNDPLKVDTFFAKNFERHHSGREYLNHRSYVFLTFSTKTRINNSNSSSGIFQAMNFKPQKVTREFVQEMISKAAEFISIVTRFPKVSARQLGDSDYLGTYEHPGIIQQFMMLGEKSPMMSDIELHPDEVRVFDRHMISFAINEVDYLPAEVSNIEKVDAMCGPTSSVFLSTGAKIGLLLDCNHIVNQYVVTLPQDATLKNLDSKRKRMVSGSERNAGNRVGAEEINDFIENLQTESRMVIKTHCNILAFGDAGSRNELKSKVSTALSSMGVVMVKLNIFDTPVLYYSAIPGAAAELGSDNLMTMELDTALCLGCMETFEKGVKGGLFRTVDSIRCVPITIDLQKAARDAGWINAFNAFVLGGTGTGKSYFMNSYLRNCYDAGESLFIIDKGDSYELVTRVIHEESGGKDGTYLSWDKEHPLSFNPFVGYSSWLDERGNLNEEEPGVHAFLSALYIMWRPDSGWTGIMKTVLFQIVRDFVVYDRAHRQEGTNPIFQDFIDFVIENVRGRIMSGEYKVGTEEISLNRFDISAFLIEIEKYGKDGIYGFLLNDPNPKDIFSNRWTVFEVDKLSQLGKESEEGNGRKKDNPLYSLVVLLMMKSFDMKMRSNPEFTILVIEEAWDAIGNESMASYINALYKTSRKFSCSVITVSQQISDIKDSPIIKDTIIANSDIRVLLDQSGNQNNFDDIQKFMGLTEIDKNLCLSVNRAKVKKFGYFYKQVFISWGTKHRGVFNTEVSLEESIAYESEKTKKQPILDRAAEVGSMIQAISEYAAVARVTKNV